MDMINTAPYIEEDRLYDYAVSCARLLHLAGESSGIREARLLTRQRKQIRRTYEAVSARYAELSSPPAACAWLMDNWYMVQRETPPTTAALASAKRLRRCREGLVILEACRCLLQSGRGQITERRCRCFLDGFQSVLVLRRSELRLFPAALRAVCIAEIARVCRRLPYAADLDGHGETLAALFNSLRFLSVWDAEKLLDALDVSAAVLSADPSGDFARMDSETRQDYLRRVEKLARQAGMEEHSYAKQLLKTARAEGKHVGFFLFPEAKPLSAPLYLTALLLPTLLLALAGAGYAHSAAVFFLLLLPLSELNRAFLDAVLLRVLPPRRLPRMDLEKGIPPEGRTLCVISALLTDPTGAAALARKLEELRLLCRAEGENLLFGLLADLPENEKKSDALDDAVLTAASAVIDDLNRKYGGGFYLFHRERSFDGELWTGWERKRGALLELARFLCGRPSSLQIRGNREALAGARFLLTLDSDTRLGCGAVGALIGCLLHPLVRPRWDAEEKRVLSGHAVLQPRMGVDLQSANATDFALIFAGSGGCDPYGGDCSDLDMDLFGHGGFAGKGLLDVRSLLLASEAHIPEGAVLSHDALEGAYLRGGFVGDLAFYDAFPARPLAYYKRLHRWVRGDWQNLRWAFARELPLSDRWRLLDKLRRSLLPVSTLMNLLLFFFLRGTGTALAAAISLLSLLSSLLLSLLRDGTRRREKVRLRRYTRLLTGVGGAIVQTLVRLWLLPWEAWICLSASLTALWRMFVSHKRLLQWQTAAQSENAGNGLGAHLRAMWPSMLLGLALLLLSPTIPGQSAGLLWLLAPVMTAALALPAKKEARLSASDEAYLRAAAEKSFSYYQNFCTEEDHFLPPDNFQEQPPVGLAHRTSPTNMGLALASCAAAHAMGLVDSEDTLCLIRRMLSTLEQLPRFRGHFYNWYDTRSLEPLEPRYVSTVDSGNLCACLLVLRAALPELGGESLRHTVDQFIGEMDFSPLYDRDRGLFYICYDPRKDRGAGGWYDLMASEAMLTSYLAVARGDVPWKHWRRLSRAQLQKDGYRGLASWTGTMFEYLMPALFLPFPRGSLLDESSRFCLYVQRRRVFAGRPWGVSESAYASLDNALNYRYKANGCAALALKRGQDADMVVSPYSSFLALAVDPGAALRNLRRLEAFGALGRFGFLEALDFSPSRCRHDQGERVSCYMAHHVGMSILAAANAVCGGWVRKCFFGDPAMVAWRLLLEERLPDSGQVIRRDNSPIPEQLSRGGEDRWQLSGNREDRQESCCLLSNGVYNIMLSSRGAGFAVCRGLSIYGDPNGSVSGLRLTLRRGEEEVPLCPGERPERWTLSEDLCRWVWQRDGLKLALSAAVAAGELGERWEFLLRGEQKEELELCFSFRPILARFENYVNHPAYWKLGLVPQQSSSSLLLHRLRRGEQASLWLCLRCDAPGVRFDTGPCADPLVTLRMATPLQPGEDRSFRIALCLGRKRQDALDGAARILGSEGRGNMPLAAAAKLGMSAGEIGESMALLSTLLRPLSQAAPRRALWPYGISGDLPLLLCDVNAPKALPLLRRFCLLKSCGLEADLVYLSPEGGEYQQPFRRQIHEALDRLGLEALLGSRGGVHFASTEARALLQSRAAYAVGELLRSYRPLLLPALGSPDRAGIIPEHRWNDGEFEFYVNQSLPPRSWQQILSNGHLSAIVTECGMAGLWLENARELRLTACDDPRSTGGSERIWVELDGRHYSLFAANDGIPCRVRYRPGLARWEKEISGHRIRTTAFLAPEKNARILLIEGAAGLRLIWAMQPLLGPDASSLRCRYEQGLFRAENPECYLPNVQFFAGASCPSACRTAFLPPAMRMSLAAEEDTVLVCGCAEARDILELCKPVAAKQNLEDARADWKRRLSVLRIDTGDKALDALCNTWAPYQAITCRLWGRGSLYQSGGAIGFRDQLQDAVNLLLLDPSLARAQILDCCRHQYVEGDVMHWWHPHPEGDKGIRSRCSDDLLWLVWALCDYVDASGDLALCEEEEHYVNSKPLSTEERDRYEVPQVSEASASVLFHARAALDACIGRGCGPHGLPWIGSGDWNDGLDAVQGESVWLAFFLSACAGRFADLLDRLCKPGSARYRDCAAAMLSAAEASWNGRWYRRGYWADGEVLGGDERIDALPQAWAALCGADSEHVRVALDAALERLVDEEHGLIKLFSPPFGEEERYPGYLAGYGEGFRENGGQYTHGALWLLQACLRTGRTADAERLLRLLLPAGHDPARYEAEPYVLAADLAAAPGIEGQAGWTWYTGSAGWFFRIVTGDLLGLRLKDGKLRLRPLRDGFTAVWRDRQGRAHEIAVNGGEIRVDGAVWDGAPLGDDEDSV